MRFVCRVRAVFFAGASLRESSFCSWESLSKLSRKNQHSPSRYLSETGLPSASLSIVLKQISDNRLPERAVEASASLICIQRIGSEAINHLIHTIAESAAGWYSFSVSVPRSSLIFHFLSLGFTASFWFDVFWFCHDSNHLIMVGDLERETAFKCFSQMFVEVSESELLHSLHSTTMFG